MSVHFGMTTVISAHELLKRVLDQPWHWDCEIIPDYMPPYPRADTKPRVVVRYRDQFLRHSKGPHQGFFWDLYGDDMQEVELAVIALSRAPVPFVDSKKG